MKPIYLCGFVHKRNCNIIHRLLPHLKSIALYVATGHIFRIKSGQDIIIIQNFAKMAIYKKNMKDKKIKQNKDRSIVLFRYHSSIFGHHVEIKSSYPTIVLCQ